MQQKTQQGSPWGLNAYGFEAGNKTLKALIASGKGIASQICRALSKNCAIQLLEVIIAPFHASSVNVRVSINLEKVVTD